MLNVKVNGANVFNPIEGRMNEIIEDFVKFYGEEYRQRITDRLNNTTCIFTSRSTNSISSTYDNVNQYYKDKIKYVDKLLFSRIPNYTPKQDNSMQFFNNYNDAYMVKRDLSTGMFNVFTYDKIIDMIGMFNLDNPADSLVNYSHKALSEWLKNNENKERVLQCATTIVKEYELNFAKLYKAINIEQRNALEQLKEYNDIIEKEKDVGDKEIKQTLIKYLQKNKKIEKEVSSNELENLADTFYSLLQKDSSEFVNAKQFANFEQKMYTKLFNYLGFNFDNMIEYQTNKKLIAAIFNKSLINQVQKIYKESAINSCKANPYIQDALKTIKNLNIKGGNISITAVLLDFAYNNALQGAVTLQYIDSITNELKFICIFPDSVTVSDVVIFHELNHVVESDALLLKNNMYIGKTGFETMKIKFLNKDFNFNQLKASTKQVARENRESELFSEAINDYFAIQINGLAKLDRAKKYYSFGKNYSSSYSICHDLLHDFIEKYKDKLIECRMSKNYDSFKNHIGPTYFSALCTLVNYFINYTQLYDNEFINALLEISQTVKIPLGSTMLNYKKYINKDILWSPATQNVISCFRQFDYVLNSIDKYTKHTQQNATTKEV